MTTEVKIYENPQLALAAIAVTFLVVALMYWNLAFGIGGIIVLCLAGLVGSHLGLQTDHMVLTTRVEVLEGRLNAALELVGKQQAQIQELKRNKANLTDLLLEKLPG